MYVCYIYFVFFLQNFATFLSLTNVFCDHNLSKKNKSQMLLLLNDFVYKAT